MKSLILVEYDWRLISLESRIHAGMSIKSSCKKVNFAPIYSPGTKMTYPKYFTANNKNHNKNKRLSLLTGKQLYYTPGNRHGKRYRHFQLFIYNFLERPTGIVAGIYQIIM